jgi:hypothetical protein
MPSNNYIYKMSNAGGMSTVTRYTDMLAGNAAFQPSSYDSIATFTSSGSTNLIEFTSIPSTYTHLQLRIFARSALSAATDTVYFRLNGDFSNNYSRHLLSGNGSSVSATGFYPENVIFAGTIAAASSTANTFGSYIVDILDYKNTNKNKVTRSLGGYDANGSGIIDFRSANWNSTTAITSIVLANYASGSNFANGSHFALYGIKGA